MGKNHFYQLSINKTVVRAKPVGPKSWGSEENLYSQTVEDAFAKIESKVAQLHEKMKCEPDLTVDERYGWSMWLLASYLRTPSAFLSSAAMSQIMDNHAQDILQTGCNVLAKCVTNSDCIELIADRNWEVLTFEKPYFLKPDSGVIMTDRLDNKDSPIVYPLTPFLCFVARGQGRHFLRVSVEAERVFELNSHILSWSDQSVACTSEFWSDYEELLRRAVRTNLAAGQYSPPTSGRFFSLETVQTDESIRATILGPRGPVVMTVAKSAIRPVDEAKRPAIPGLYEVEQGPSVALEVRYTDDDSEVDYAAAAQVMMQIGQGAIAVDFARRALRKDEGDVLSKLVILTTNPEENIGALMPRNPIEAAELAIWRALNKRDPLGGLKISSQWLRDHPDFKRLAQANFLCALLTYGAKLFQALCGSGEKLPFLDDSTPLPDGVVDLVKRAYAASETDIVSEVQRHIGNIDLKASGLAADILNVCGLNQKLRLYRKS